MFSTVNKKLLTGLTYRCFVCTPGKIEQTETLRRNVSVMRDNHSKQFLGVNNRL